MTSGSNGRHPMSILILVAFIFGQITVLVNLFTGGELTGFSAVAEGWQVAAWNIIGLIACTTCLIGVFFQRPKAIIRNLVTGLILESIGMISLSAIALLYAVHNFILRGNAPFILFAIAAAAGWRWVQARRELRNIQLDVKMLNNLGNRNPELTGNRR